MSVAVWVKFAGKKGRPIGENLLDDVILPQFKNIVVDSLEAARPKMAQGSDYYKSFHMFGYDFLIDADFDVKLCDFLSFRQFSILSFRHFARARFVQRWWRSIFVVRLQV
jgi:hypothetical protein